jgi:hypothetical protein
VNIVPFTKIKGNLSNEKKKKERKEKELMLFLPSTSRGCDRAKAMVRNFT